MIKKDEFEQGLDQFQSVLNLPVSPPSEEVQTLLSCSRGELKRRSREDLAIDAVLLAQYSLYIKRQYNELSARVLWCDTNIKSIVGREINNLENLYGWQEKYAHIARNDPHAKQLVDMKLTLESRKQVLEELDKKLDFVSQCIRNLTYCKGN